MSDLRSTSGFPGGFPGGPVPPHYARSAQLARNWWAIALRGLFALVFGVIALASPIVALGSLVLLFGIYMLADGLFAIVAGVRAATHHERWALLILEGILDLVAGAVAFALPGLTVLILVTLLGVWSVLTGILLLVAAFRLHSGHGGWWLGLSGVVSIVWGVLLYLAPITASVVLTWWLGIYALVFGVGMLIFAFRLRSAAASRMV